MSILKTTETLLNNLDKTPTVSFEEKQFKQKWVDAMLKEIKLKFDVTYKPGKGFRLKDKPNMLSKIKRVVANLDQPRLDCIAKGLHLSDCDDDGFCNHCGHQ